MREIILKTGIVSRLLIKDGLSGNFTSLKEFEKPKSAFVVTDENVAPLYLENVVKALGSSGCKIETIVLPAGEAVKSIDSLQILYKNFLEAKVDRKSLIISLGGGVIGDITGFSAATYMRGARFIQIPTTLLAQVDASIGGKVAINHLGIKNLIGTFYQPEMILIDPAVLQTLPEIELFNGYSETLKAAIINEPSLFHLLNENSMLPQLPESELLNEIIYRAASVKTDIVEKDERESGARRVLNFGHTIGHALEEYYSFKEMPHGKAVAIGMVLESRLGNMLKLTTPAAVEKIEKAVKKIGFDVTLREAKVEDIVNLMFSDKKTTDLKLVFAIPVDIGQVDVIEDVSPALVHEVIEEALS